MDRADDDHSIFLSCLPLFPDQEWDWPENESHQNDAQVSDLHPPGADHEVESVAERDGVEGIRLIPYVPDHPEGSQALVSGQISQGTDHAVEDGDLVVGMVLKDPADDDHSIFSSCLPLFPDQDCDWPENKSQQDDVQVSDLHSLGADHEVESGAENDGVQVIRLVPDVPDHPEGSGTLVAGQIPQEPDHAVGDGGLVVGMVVEGPDPPRENEVGEFKIQVVGRDILGSEYSGKDGERGSSFPQRAEYAPSVSLTPEASSNVRKQRGRPPKHPELAPDNPVHPRKSHGSPCKRAAASPQTLPGQQSTQHPESPKETRCLPDGWTTEVKVRKIGRSTGHKDKTYIEASTNKRCRSIPDVWRYIEKKRKLQGEIEANEPEVPCMPSELQN